MSTKTNFKRVALVAVAALGLGVLTSVAPANAADIAAKNFVGTDTAAADNYGVVSFVSTGATTQAAEMYLSGQMKLKTSAGAIDLGDDTQKARLRITQGSGQFTFAATDADATAVTSATYYNGQYVTWTASADTNDLGDAGDSYAYFKPSAAGTVVVQLQSLSAAGAVTVLSTLTINVITSIAQSLSDSYDSASSYFSRVATATGTVATNVDAVTTTVANGSCAWIAFDLMDAYGQDLSTGAIVATSSSADAILGFNSSTAIGAALYGQSVVMADPGDADYVAVCQATANKPVTTTVSVTYNGTSVGSKTVTIAGDIAKIVVGTTAAQLLKVAQYSGTRTGQGAFFVYDSAGNQLDTAATPSADTSRYSTTVTAVAAAGVGSSTSATGTALGWTCATAASGSINARIYLTNAVGAKVYSNDFLAQCGGATPYAVTASLDKASYVPGDVATLTIKATDSNGKAVADTATLGTGVAVAGSNMTQVTEEASTDTFTWGAKTYKFVVGSTEGSYQMTVSTPAYAATGVVDVTVPYKISTGSASVTNADVLKAIVSLIASINKQIAALQKALLKK